MKNYNPEALIAHLKEKWGEHVKCPMCSTSDWKVPPEEFSLPVTEESGSGQSGYVPLAPVTCGNCGFVANVHLLFVKGLNETLESGSKDNG